MLPGLRPVLAARSARESGLVSWITFRSARFSSAQDLRNGAHAGEPDFWLAGFGFVLTPCDGDGSGPDLVLRHDADDDGFHIPSTTGSGFPAQVIR